MLKKGIKMLKDADSGFSGFIVTLLGHDIDSEIYMPIMESVIEILEITEEKVLNTPFVKKSLAVYRNFHLRNTNNSLGKWPSLVDTFTTQFLDNFNHDTMSSFKYVSLLQNTTYPLPKLKARKVSKVRSKVVSVDGRRRTEESALVRSPNQRTT